MNTGIQRPQIHQVATGRGPPVAVIGGPWLGHTYLRAMDALAEGHRVVYHDPRGAGRTPLDGRAAATLPELVADLDAVREAQGLARWSVVGHSFGANVAMLYACKHPERVASLVVSNAGPPLAEDLMKAFFAEMMGRRREEDVEELRMLEGSGAFSRRDVNAVERWFRLTYLPFFNHRATAERLQLAFTPDSARSAPGSEMRLFQELGPLGLLERIGDISCPTLVVHAERDPLPKEWSHRIAQRIPGARLETLPGTNHFAYVEDPAVFFGVVKPFLAQHHA